MCACIASVLTPGLEYDSCLDRLPYFISLNYVFLQSVLPDTKGEILSPFFPEPLLSHHLNVFI